MTRIKFVGGAHAPYRFWTLFLNRIYENRDWLWMPFLWIVVVLGLYITLY